MTWDEARARVEAMAARVTAQTDFGGGHTRPASAIWIEYEDAAALRLLLASAVSLENRERAVFWAPPEHRDFVRSLLRVDDDERLSRDLRNQADRARKAKP